MGVGSPTPSAATAAGKAGDDDIEQGDDSTNDGLKDGTDAVDDGHEACTDGLENGTDLQRDLVLPQVKIKRGEIE